MILLRCDGGDLALPDPRLVLVSREDGGNLVVTPRSEVWERSELSREELMLWSFLVAAAGRAMLDVLPQLADGCINYWEAGNWALNDAADPAGPKNPRQSRRVHLHLLGRSPRATHAAWRWGEAPTFPDFVDRHAWAAGFSPLTAAECVAIVERTEVLLDENYGVGAEPWAACGVCGYPEASEAEHEHR